MKSKTAGTTARSNVPQRRYKPMPPPQPDRWMMFLYLCEQASWSQVTKNSYVISRFWAWFSRIQIGPTVKIPIPRFMSTRDP